MAIDVIALIFDFDNTLVPDSTTAFLKSRGIDTDNFWKIKANELIREGWDPILAYLKLMIDLTKPGEPLEGLTNKELREFGSTLKPYSGLQSFFRNLKKKVDKEYSKTNITIELYVVSSGLEEIVKGCKKVSAHLTGFWGCRLAPEHPGGQVKYVKRSINFTEKTRYLYEINKGLPKKNTDGNPLLVNIAVEKAKRRIPFRNMIYVGDGMTDIPCFSLVKSHKGVAFGILHRDKHGAAKREIFKNLIVGNRTMSTHSPKYGKNDDLSSVLQTAVVTRCSEIVIERKRAFFDD